MTEFFPMTHSLVGWAGRDLPTYVFDMVSTRYQMARNGDILARIICLDGLLRIILILRAI